MRKFSKYIYLSLTVFFMISSISLLLAWFGGEHSVFRNLFNGICFYAALIGVFIICIHISILTLYFIVKYLRYIYLLLKYTFIVSAISLLLAWFGGEASDFGIFFIGISFYGTLISIFLSVIHLVGLILSIVFKNNSKA